jgi:Ser-tRNA(Ala) deacylase AlaX
MTERSHQDAIATDQLYLRDAYQRTMDAEVVAVDHDRVALDRTVFYATGGGQPHDTGILAADGAHLFGHRRPQGRAVRVAHPGAER